MFPFQSLNLSIINWARTFDVQTCPHAIHPALIYTKSILQLNDVYLLKLMDNERTTHILQVPTFQKYLNQWHEIMVVQNWQRFFLELRRPAICYLMWKKTNMIFIKNVFSRISMLLTNRFHAARYFSPQSLSIDLRSGLPFRLRLYIHYHHSHIRILSTLHAHTTLPSLSPVCCPSNSLIHYSGLLCDAAYAYACHRPLSAHSAYSLAHVSAPHINAGLTFVKLAYIP